MRWTSDILQQIKPRHLWRALVDPKRAVRELKYRYTFTGKVEFCAFLAASPTEKVQSYFSELMEQEKFVQDLDREIATKSVVGRGPMGEEAEILYVMTRLMRPEIVLETGVGAGKSSAYILKALQANGTGRLYSIDLPMADGLSGWAVPKELHRYWENHLGTSAALMEKLLKRIGAVHLFVHDSDHSYENMTFEFNLVWPFIEPGGLILAHDVGRHNALFDFCREQGILWWHVRTFPVLGGFRKPA